MAEEPNMYPDDILAEAADNHSEETPAGAGDTHDTAVSANDESMPADTVLPGTSKNRRPEPTTPAAQVQKPTTPAAQIQKPATSGETTVTANLSQQSDSEQIEPVNLTADSVPTSADQAAARQYSNRLILGAASLIFLLAIAAVGYATANRPGNPHLGPVTQQPDRPAIRVNPGKLGITTTHNNGTTPNVNKPDPEGVDSTDGIAFLVDGRQIAVAIRGTTPQSVQEQVLGQKVVVSCQPKNASRQHPRLTARTTWPKTRQQIIVTFKDHGILANCSLTSANGGPIASAAIAEPVTAPPAATTP